MTGTARHAGPHVGAHASTWTPNGCRGAHVQRRKSNASRTTTTQYRLGLAIENGGDRGRLGGTLQDGKRG